MRTYTVIHMDNDLLPQVVGELLSYTTDANLVEVVHGDNGREIRADPALVEAWYQDRLAAQEQPSTPEPVPAPLPAPGQGPLDSVAPLVPEAEPVGAPPAAEPRTSASPTPTTKPLPSASAPASTRTKSQS